MDSKTNKQSRKYRMNTLNYVKRNLMKSRGKNAIEKTKATGDQPWETKLYNDIKGGG